MLLSLCDRFLSIVVPGNVLLPKFRRGKANLIYERNYYGQRKEEQTSYGNTEMDFQCSEHALFTWHLLETI